jgi:c-di-AMP phosphodiesterase-like protein
VNVQLVLEEFGGGGNASAAGAQLEQVPLREAVNRLCTAIDAYLDS